MSQSSTAVREPLLRIAKREGTTMPQKIAPRRRRLCPPKMVKSRSGRFSIISPMSSDTSATPIAETIAK